MEGECLKGSGLQGNGLVLLGAVMWECTCVSVVLLGLVVEGCKIVAVFWNVVL